MKIWGFLESVGGTIAIYFIYIFGKGIVDVFQGCYSSNPFLISWPAP